MGSGSSLVVTVHSKLNVSQLFEQLLDVSHLLLIDSE